MLCESLKLLLFFAQHGSELQHNALVVVGQFSHENGRHSALKEYNQPGAGANNDQ